MDAFLVFVFFTAFIAAAAALPGRKTRRRYGLDNAGPDYTYGCMRVEGDWVTVTTQSDATLSASPGDDFPFVALGDPVLALARFGPAVRRLITSLTEFELVQGVARFRRDHSHDELLHIAATLEEALEVTDIPAALLRNYLGERDVRMRLTLVKSSEGICEQLIVQACSDSDELIRATAFALCTPEMLAEQILSGAQRAREEALRELAQQRDACVRLLPSFEEPVIIARLVRMAHLMEELPRMRQWALDPTMHAVREVAAEAVAALDPEREAFFLQLLQLPHEEAKVIALDHLSRVGSAACADAVLQHMSSTSLPVRSAAKQAMEALRERTPDTLAGAVAVAENLQGAVSIK